MQGSVAVSNNSTHTRREPPPETPVDTLATPPQGATEVAPLAVSAAPLLPIELAIAEDALEHVAREFISELVDVSGELRELIEAAE